MVDVSSTSYSGNGFITAIQAEQNNAFDVAVHNEVTSIESQILTQSNLGFLNITVNNTTMTSQSFNSPVVINTVNSTSIPAGATALTFSDTTGVFSGMSVFNMTHPNSLSGTTTVSSVPSGTSVAISAAVITPGVLNGDVIKFSKTFTTNAQSASGTNTLYFASTTGLTAGLAVSDSTTSGAIPAGTTIVSVASTSIVLSNSLTGTVYSGDSILFALSLTIVTSSVSSIVVNNSSYTAGTPVTFTTTGTLPTPLTNSTVYYLIPSGTANTYYIASTLQDAMSSIASVTLTSVPTGTNSLTVVLQSEIYYRAWQQYAYSSEYKMYSNRMYAVINYFTALGYSIERRQATDTNGNGLDTFEWYITW